MKRHDLGAAGLLGEDVYRSSDLFLINFVLKTRRAEYVQRVFVNAPVAIIAKKGVEF